MGQGAAQNIQNREFIHVSFSNGTLGQFLGCYWGRFWGQNNFLGCYWGHNNPIELPARYLKAKYGRAEAVKKMGYGMEEMPFLARRANEVIEMNRASMMWA